MVQSTQGTVAQAGTLTSPYAERKLDFQFYLKDSSSTIYLTGLRAHVTIEHAQIPNNGPYCVARIYGMTLDQMNSLSRAGLLWRAARNEVLITAGDDVDGMVTVFSGEIIQSYPDFDQP